MSRQSLSPVVTPETLLTAHVPPHDLAAERAVLGGILLEHADALARLGGLAAEDFYQDAHRQLFAAMMALASRGEGIDLLTVTGELVQAGTLAEVGGTEALGHLVDEAGLLVMLPEYARMIRELAGKREVIRQATEAIHAAYAPGPVGPVLERAQQALTAIAERVDGGPTTDGPAGAERAGTIARAVVRSL